MTASSIALVQANPVVGDVEGNLDRLEAMIGHLDSTKVRLAVTSELAVVGYPPRDLLDHLDPDTILTSILSRTWPVPVLIGTLCMGRRVDRSTEPFSFKMGPSSFGREASPADLRCLR